MARTRTSLLSFRQPKKSPSDTGEFTDAQTVSYYRKLFLAQSGGSFRNSSDINAYVQALQSLPQTPELMIEIADMQGQALQMDNTQQQVFNSVAYLEDSLKDDLSSSLRSSGSDLNLVLSNQAIIYSEYLDKMDQFASDTLENYGANTQLDENFYKLKDEIEQKAEYLTNLSAQINNPELAGGFDPETVSLQVTTNPSNGTITGISFTPRGKVESGYVETDVRFRVNDIVGAIPMSINAIENGSTPDGTQRRMARLGDMKLFGTFSRSAKNDSGLDSEYGLYELKAQDTAGWSPFSTTPVEAGRENGFNIGDFRIDSNDIASNIFVRRGSRLFFTQKDGTLLEFSGASYREKTENAISWMKSMGYSNSEQAYYPQAISADYLNMPDGQGGSSSRILPFTPGLPTSRSSMDPTTAPPAEQTMPLQQTQSTESQGFFSSGQSSESAAFTPGQPAQSSAQSTLQSAVPGFFANRVNRQNKPDQPKSSFVGDIIDKGKSFFRNLG